MKQHARLALVILALLNLAAVAPPANYDRPLEFRRVDLGASASSPGARNEVRCHYYAAFMVKEIDLREKGAAQLSLLPPGVDGRPDCQRANAASEQVIPPNTWEGYFAGARGDLAVFGASDGVDGGMGFALFRLGGTTPVYASTANAAVRFETGPAGSVVLRFDRVRRGACSVAIDGKPCATSIARAEGIANLDVAMCRAGYAAVKRYYATEACNNARRADPACIAEKIKAMSTWDQAPSVVAVPVRVELWPTTVVERPVADAKACRPAD